MGFGAYFVVFDLGLSIDTLKHTVKVKRFEQTSSTKLELQTLLWALNEMLALANGGNLVITAYTDSQNIVGLPGRRARLEQNNYVSTKNKRLNNYALYQEFYRLTSELNCQFVKVAGHQVGSKEDEIDKLFNLVDRASRHALREDI